VPSLTEKDLDDLDFALGLDVDYVALSFVRSASDVLELKRLNRRARLERAGDREIEKAEAIERSTSSSRRPTG